MQYTVYCAICGDGIDEAMFGTGQLADNKVYKLGELAYIELAHTECTKGYQWGAWERD